MGEHIEITDKIVGYRLLDKNEILKEGDVCGWTRKIKLCMGNWEGQTADRFNQPVFRPLSSFVDFKGIS